MAKDQITWIGFLLLTWMIWVTFKVSEKFNGPIGWTIVVSLMMILAIMMRFDWRVRQLEAGERNEK